MQPEKRASVIRPTDEDARRLARTLLRGTRFAALAICIDMLVAIFGVHWKNGFLHQGNYQFPLALAAIAFSLMFSGPGPISIDALRGKGR